MARRLKKCKKTKNVAKETSLPETEKFEFDIGALSLAELLHLAEGYVPDPSEETVVMTRREMNLYIKEKMTEYSTHKPPEINPFIDLYKQCKILLKEVEEKEQQVLKALKDFAIMYKNQLEVCKHLGTAKEPAKSVNIEEIPVLERKFEGVDLTSD
ncbi:hypothetical protein TNIN_362771 [Trichonephila inaurata madagascariensis]|uniref:Uncharacterized protein n=1 Tax=Trichonephila inaurata madagascariensis TaxID=2747483 RepID=A0A8X6YKZ9_9ARAC|nr:hypothetical protein TNIN_362771 [Trichonephila inaurata madagascariensis]